ncbi:MAG: NADH-quinone oxidoreductase subunit M [Chitinophagales bacterium]|nr:NADH-quinone oxidoreductase subunit M [Chitinophagales bacterium]MDW8272984.1 NADH-quinone oxidoreductase subunit M [Chitinophagales bacterium]
MLILVILSVALVGSILAWLSGNRLASKVALFISLLNLVLAATGLKLASEADFSLLAFSASWISQPKINFQLIADGIGILMIGLTNALIPLIILASSSRSLQNERVFYALILFMQFALIGVFAASDGFLYYIFWELALIPIFFIAWLWGDGQREYRSKVILKFFIYTLAGSLFMLFGFIYLYLKAGSFALKDLYALNLSEEEQKWLFWAFFIAFAIKIPVFPFHTWQPETYTESPTAGSMLLSGIMLKMGIYSMLRWLLPVVPEGVAFWTPIVIVLCVIGVVYGSLIAIKQDNIKRLVAYSSFAHVGLIAAGVFTFSKAGLQGSVVQMIAHGFNVVGLFFAGEIIYRRISSYHITRMGGIRNFAPHFTTYFLIITLASVALPTTNAFVGEFLLLYGIYEYNTVLALVAGLTVVLGAVYMLRMFQRVMLGNIQPSQPVFADLNLAEKAVFLPLVLVIFACGIYPHYILKLAEPAVDAILQAALR